MWLHGHRLRNRRERWRDPDEPPADDIFALSLHEDLLSDHPYVEPSADEPTTRGMLSSVAVAARLREQRPLSVALIHLMMMAIDSIVTTTVSLIQCVVIDGEKRLYIQADVKCWDELSWLQYPLLILIVAIAAGFLAIPLWFDWFMPIVGRVAPPSGLRTILAEPFREGCGSWLFVMALERVTLAMLSAQAWTSTLRLLAMTATCLLAYHIQQQVRPFRDDRKNRDRGLHLLGLSLLAMLQFPFSDYQTAALAPPKKAQNELYRLVDSVRDSLAVLALPLVLLMLPLALRLYDCARHARVEAVARGCARLRRSLRAQTRPAPRYDPLEDEGDGRRASILGEADDVGVGAEGVGGGVELERAGAEAEVQMC